MTRRRMKRRRMTRRRMTIRTMTIRTTRKKNYFLIFKIFNSYLLAGSGSAYLPCGSGFGSWLPYGSWSGSDITGFSHILHFQLCRKPGCLTWFLRSQKKRHNIVCRTAKDSCYLKLVQSGNGTCNIFFYLYRVTDVVTLPGLKSAKLMSGWGASCLPDTGTYTSYIILLHIIVLFTCFSTVPVTVLVLIEMNFTTGIFLSQCPVYIIIFSCLKCWTLR